VKISNKTFLNKLFQEYFDTFVFERINKKEEYVEISEPLVFENGKILILEMEHPVLAKIPKYLMVANYALIAFAAYKLILALYSYSILRRLLWTTIFIFSLNSHFGFKNNQEYIIQEISIFQDGKVCEVKTLKGGFPIDINKIRKINLEEALYMAKSLEILKKQYIPIVLDTKLYMIPLGSKILRKDLLPHISEGKYLKFKEIIQKDKTIQI
jgi:hypothetical protein